MAGIIARRLIAEGIDYHPRTIRRQILGVVETVPPEVESCLLALCVDEAFGGDRKALDRALGDQRKLLVDAEARAPYVTVERLGRLVELWLYFNRGQSKRALAERLHHDLARQGVGLTRESIQWKLASNGHLVRREVLAQLVEYLTPHGIPSEEKAHDFLIRRHEDIQGTLEGRSLIDAASFRRACRLWQILSREASTRRLATLLRERLAEGGVRVGIEHLQRAIGGKTPRVRQDLVLAMDALLASSMPEGETLDSLTAKIEWSSPRNLDLAWVRCEPIADLAQAWLQANPGVSMRQLALRVVKTIRRMGYRSSHNTIQPILGGWKKRTRGYVFRGLLKQFPDRPDDRIPDDAFIVPGGGFELEGFGAKAPEHKAKARAPSGGGGRSPSPTPSSLSPSASSALSSGRRSKATKSSSAPKPVALRTRDASSSRSPLDEHAEDLDTFISRATEHLAQAKSPLFAKLAALRASKLYDISAEDAYATIMSQSGS
ncbi:MAG: hypothetical protein H6729_15010 [Deltaproteobacteria bacterium]|nr:hypothetical protein [Deltaproteobacteria bacterium]